MQDFRTVSLSEIIAQNSSQGADLFLSKMFRCAKNKDVEHFLLNNAVRFEQAKMTRTHLVFDNKTGELVAYFSLSFKSIEVSVSKSRLKKLTGGLTNSNKLNVFLIAQIGKNSLIENNPVTLQAILQSVYLKLRNAQTEIGGRIAVLECENNDRLITHYEKNGFALVDTVDETDLRTMFAVPEF